MLCDCNAIDSFLLLIKFIVRVKITIFFLLFFFFFKSIEQTHMPTLYVSQVMMMEENNKKKSIEENRTEEKIKIVVLNFKLRIQRKSFDFLSFVKRLFVHSSEHDHVCS